MLQYREREIVRLCMKHFRQRNYMEALRSLENDTKITLEDPLLTELHSILVNNADYEATEKFLENCVRSKFFFYHINTFNLSMTYNRIYVNIVFFIYVSNYYQVKTLFVF